MKEEKQEEKTQAIEEELKKKTALSAVFKLPEKKPLQSSSSLTQNCLCTVLMGLVVMHVGASPH